MPTLQMRDVPESLYRKLQLAAEREHRSLSQQAIVLLGQSLGVSAENRGRRRAILERAAASSKGPAKYPRGMKPEELIRQDQQR